MGIESKKVNTYENVTKNITSGWQSKTDSNKKISLKDRKSPLKDFIDATKTNAETKIDKVSSKIDKVTFSNLTSNLKDKVDVKDMKIDSEATELMKKNLIASIGNTLESPGMPLNAKSELRKAIDSVCSKNVNLGLNSSLRDILNLLAISDLMSLIKCLSDPIKLAQVTATLLSSNLGDKVITKGFNNAIKSKNVSVSNVKDMLKSETGKRLLKESKNSILSAIDNNVESDKSSDNDLLSLLPKDSDSMCLYNDTGLFNTTVKNVNKNKPSQNLSNSSSGSIDENTSLLVKASTYKKMTSRITF